MDVAHEELLPKDSCKHILLSISTSLFHTATIKITQETVLQTFLLSYKPSQSVQEDVTGLSSMGLWQYSSTETYRAWMGWHCSCSQKGDKLLERRMLSLS